MLGKLINTCHIYTARMSPALNGSSALQRFKRSNASEICNRIMFHFYLGLPYLSFNLINPALIKQVLLISITIVTHTHTPQMPISAQQWQLYSSWWNQCLPIPLPSCDWPAQDESDITGCPPLHPDHSPGSHSVWRWWQGNKREE